MGNQCCSATAQKTNDMPKKDKRKKTIKRDPKIMPASTTQDDVSFQSRQTGEISNQP